MTDNQAMNDLKYQIIPVKLSGVGFELLLHYRQHMCVACRHTDRHTSMLGSSKYQSLSKSHEQQQKIQNIDDQGSTTKIKTQVSIKKQKFESDYRKGNQGRPFNLQVVKKQIKRQNLKKYDQMSSSKFRSNTVSKGKSIGQTKTPPIFDQKNHKNIANQRSICRNGKVTIVRLLRWTQSNKIIIILWPLISLAKYLSRAMDTFMLKYITSAHQNRKHQSQQKVLKGQQISCYVSDSIQVKCIFFNVQDIRSTGELKDIITFENRFMKMSQFRQFLAELKSFEQFVLTQFDVIADLLNGFLINKDNGKYLQAKNGQISYSVKELFQKFMVKLHSGNLIVNDDEFLVMIRVKNASSFLNIGVQQLKLIFYRIHVQSQLQNQQYGQLVAAKQMQKKVYLMLQKSQHL